MRKTLYGDEHPSYAEALSVKGKILDHQGRFDEEEEIWKQVLNIQARVYGENHPALATTYHDYANMHLRRGEFKEARELLEKSLEITKKILGEEHLEYFGRLVLFANCFYEQQQYDQAQDQLTKAQEIQQKYFDELQHPHIARMWQLQSAVHSRLGSFDKAIENINKAIRIKQNIYGEKHPSAAEALEIKADLLLSQFEIAESKEILQKIKEIRAEAYGKGHPVFADYELRMAEWHAIQGNYDEAQTALASSLKTYRERQFAQGHPQVIQRLVMSARLARLSSDIDGANKRIAEAKEALGSRLKEERTLLIVSVLKESAHVLRKQSNYQGALEELEKAIGIEEKILDPSSHIVLETLIGKIKLLSVMHRFEEARSKLERGRAEIKDNMPVFRRLLADFEEQEGILSTSAGEHQKAIECLDRALQLKSEVLGDKHVELAKLYMDKSAALRRRGQYKDAAKCARDALEIDNQHFGVNHIFFARIFLENGRTFYCQKLYVPAKEQLREALDIYEKQPDQDLREYANTLATQALVHLVTASNLEPSNHSTRHWPSWNVFINRRILPVRSSKRRVCYLKSRKKEASWYWQ